MAGPSIVVRVLADMKGLSASLAATGKQAEAASTRIRGAFTSALGTLNSTGVLGPFGESIAAVNDSLDAMAEKGKTAGKVMLGLGGTLVGVGAGLTALGSKDQAARQQLQAAVEATGARWDDYDRQVEAAIKHQERFGDTANQTQDALRVLTTATNSPARALGLLSEATDLAAAKHESLTQAATDLGKVYNGNTKLLKQFGITVTNTAGVTKAAATAAKQAQSADKALASAKQHLADVEAVDAGKKHLTVTEAIRLRDAEQRVRDATTASVSAHQNLTNAQTAAQKATTGHASAVDQLAQKLKGQGAAAADTFTGKLKAITAAVEDQAAAFGQKYGPAITAGAVAITALGTVTEATSAILGRLKTSEEAATAARAAATAAAEAETAALETEAAAATAADVASLPIIATVGLIVLAVAALGVAAYEIYTHWKTIWAGMKAAAEAVWDWIKTKWPLLLTILLGPIGLAAAEIIKHWRGIWTGIQTVWQWIRDAWGFVAHWIVDPIKYAFDILTGNFSKLPPKWKVIFDAIGRVILAPFVEAFHAIAWLWNHTVGQLSFHIPSWVPEIGGKGFDVPKIPDIPMLAAGGLITRDGLIYAHAGEAVIPAPARLGPAVQFGDAHFHNDIDIELVMRKAAWVVQTQGV